MQSLERVALALLAVIVFALIAVPLSGAGMLVHAYGYETSGVGFPGLLGMALGMLAFWGAVLGIAVVAEREMARSGIRRPS